MSTKKKCEICFNKFEAVRSDAKYCSGACKQKAFSLKKKVDVIRAERKPVFFFDEYQDVLQERDYDTDTFTFTFFCFLRQNIPNDCSLGIVISYIDSVWVFGNYDDLITSQSYRRFFEDFLGNKFEILAKKSNAQV